MINYRLLPKVVVFFIFSTVAVCSYQLAFADDYHIENVKGNVYRFIDDRHCALFLVTKEDVRNYLSYLEDLYAVVINGIRQKKTLPQLKAEISLDKYSNLKKYSEWLPMNIEGVYERLMEESGMSWLPDSN